MRDIIKLKRKIRQRVMEHQREMCEHKPPVWGNEKIGFVDENGQLKSYDNIKAVVNPEALDRMGDNIVAKVEEELKEE